MLALMNTYITFICAAHNAGGPKLDIVIDEEGQLPGFLATTISEYAEAIYQVLMMPMYESLKLAESARFSAARFSEARFDAAFKEAMGPLLEERAMHTCVSPKGWYSGKDFYSN